MDETHDFVSSPIFLSCIWVNREGFTELFSNFV